jgi:hypothetical protein
MHPASLAPGQADGEVSSLRCPIQAYYEEFMELHAHEKTEDCIGDEHGSCRRMERRYGLCHALARRCVVERLGVYTIKYLTWLV